MVGLRTLVLTVSYRVKRYFLVVDLVILGQPVKLCQPVRLSQSVKPSQSVKFSQSVKITQSGNLSFLIFRSLDLGYESK